MTAQLARVTVRGDDTEMRGYLPAPLLPEFAEAMKPYGMVMASPLSNPKGLSDPTLNASVDRLREIKATSGGDEAFLYEVATIHYMQAMVIRGERDEKQQVASEALGRELHHFETEEMLDKIKALVLGDQSPDSIVEQIMNVVTKAG